MSLKKLSLLCLLATSFTLPLQAKPHEWLLTNFSLLDVEQGRLLSGKQLTIDEGRISAIEDSSAKLTAERTVDLQGGILMPSLWDMHVHFEGRELVEDNALLLPLYLSYGITAVREAASDLAPEVLLWRKQIESGNRLGPKIFSAGQKFEGPDSVWNGDLEVADGAEMRQGMDKLESMAVDFIKITENTMPAALYLETLKEARARGHLVSSHIPYGVSIFEAAKSGLSSIEHASYVLRLGNAQEPQIAAAVAAGRMSTKQASQAYRDGFDPEQAQLGYRMLAAKGVAVTPTLIGGHQLAWLDTQDHSQDPFMAFLTRAFTEKYRWRIERMGAQTPQQWQTRKQHYQALAAELPKLLQAGVTLLAGSDSAALNTYVYPAEGLHTELQLWQQAGVNNADILRSATINGARFMGQSKDYGSIEVGKKAELLWLQDNPLQDIGATQSIRGLFYRGTLFDSKALDAMRTEAAESVRLLDNARRQL
ncbi:amidohydrolase family protein [Shewanella algae]|uniref:amidohydrolase family protein n=1 Tax=Shewanella algae TaxID=38313 RepID=UPI001182E71C|nr:amidohydrolase family protein [Shewanella algae]MBO2644297.1 amidohydrolase family protein [Shewanella algae]TVL12226.1 hypothetical protein AYJ02_18220 [Shewanella algae]